MKCHSTLWTRRVLSKTNKSVQVVHADRCDGRTMPGRTPKEGGYGLNSRGRIDPQQRNNNIIIIMNFYSPVSNTRCHSIGHKMRIARIKIRVDSPGRWERA